MLNRWKDQNEKRNNLLGSTIYTKFHFFEQLLKRPQEDRKEKGEQRS